jgi:hypothetical protein
VINRRSENYGELRGFLLTASISVFDFRDFLPVKKIPPSADNSEKNGLVFRSAPWLRWDQFSLCQVKISSAFDNKGTPDTIYATITEMF